MFKTCQPFVALALIVPSGCGTIIHGREQKISISSRPSGAQVYYDGAVRGVTPCDVNVSRRSGKAVFVLKKDAHAEKEVVARGGVSLWALLGNLVIGGIPGYIIDAATGSFGAFYEDTYQVDLDPTPATPANNP